MRRNWISAALPALALAVLSAWAFAQTSTSRYVPYQGHLELAGEPVDGSVEMVFRFYNAPSGGSELDSATLTVDVRDGHFGVDIGPVSEATFKAPSLYLDVTVDGAALGSRQALRAVPYAMQGQVGDTFVAQNAAIGEMGHGGNWAGFRHDAVVDPTSSYALLQDSTGGETLLNAGGSDPAIGLRLNNVEKVRVDADGLSIGGTTFNGFTHSAEYTAAIDMAGTTGDERWTVSRATAMTSAEDSICFLTQHSHHHQTSVFTTNEYLSRTVDCAITTAGGNWQLVAFAQRAWDQHPLRLTCKARCLSWR